MKLWCERNFGPGVHGRDTHTNSRVSIAVHVETLPRLPWQRGVAVRDLASGASQALASRPLASCDLEHGLGRTYMLHRAIDIHAHHTTQSGHILSSVVDGHGYLSAKARLLASSFDKTILR